MNYLFPLVCCYLLGFSMQVMHRASQLERLNIVYAKTKHTNEYKKILEYVNSSSGALTHNNWTVLPLKLMNNSGHLSYKSGFPDDLRFENILTNPQRLLSFKTECRICYDQVENKFDQTVRCELKHFIQYFDKETGCFKPAFFDDENYYRELISVAYLFAKCQNKTFYQSNPILCPNPCDKQVNVCQNRNCMNLGIFKSDYECECEKKKIWSKTSLSCDTAADQGTECHDECGGVANSYGCVLDGKHGSVKCRCRGHVMGKNCDKVHDRCRDRSKPDVCQRGYRCKAYAGSSEYECVCDVTKTDAPCNEDLCADMVCVNGFCEVRQVRNSTSAVCVCDADWSGIKCDLKQYPVK
jgi:hypothetical protein